MDGIRTHKNKTVKVHQFAMVPKPEIARSRFKRQQTHKTTFDENLLVPVFVDEVLPGDTHSLRMTAFARFATPIYPIMDNLYLDSFFFFVPCRLVWKNWVRFQGEQDNPADSISYTIPQVVSPVAGWTSGSLADYFGLPCVGQTVAGQTTTANALPFRCYNLIYNQWFRDENLQNSAYIPTDDGPDITANYTTPLKRGKRPDYFTACLPWTQKGATAVSVPLVGQATVKLAASNLVTGVQPNGMQFLTLAGGVPANNSLALASGGLQTSGTALAGVTAVYPSNMYADLTTATTTTINALRLAFQTQRLLERDARGGTRYTEALQARFGVISPDGRLQRPEYLGGGTTPVNISPIPQTSATGLTGGSTPMGNLSGYGTLLAQGHGFTQSFTEHGYIIGIVNIRADITYQQGQRKLWNRLTRYDFFEPVFSELGEQAVPYLEIFATGQAGQDAATFGFQERWADYRYLPSMITGQFKSTYSAPLDAWHLAEKFTALPTLGAAFIQMNTPIARVVAVASAGAHFIFDAFFDVDSTRPMPMYSVPGHIDHF